MDFMRVNSSLLPVGRSWVDDHRRESASGHMVREDSDRDRRAEQYRSVSVTAQGNAATQGDSNVRSFAGESAAVEPGMDFMRINVPPLSATGIWGVIVGGANCTADVKYPTAPSDHCLGGTPLSVSPATCIADPQRTSPSPVRAAETSSVVAPEPNLHRTRTTSHGERVRPPPTID